MRWPSSLWRGTRAAGATVGDTVATATGVGDTVAAGNGLARPTSWPDSQRRNKHAPRIHPWDLALVQKWLNATVRPGYESYRVGEAYAKFCGWVALENPERMLSLTVFGCIMKAIGPMKEIRRNRHSYVGIRIDEACAPVMPHKRALARNWID